MISYRSALHFVANDSLNMLNPDIQAGKFILWAKDICSLLAHIYGVSFDTVVEDLQEMLDISEDD